ncbi:SH3 domain-containing protein [Streptomyces himalayensis]|uniref:SH3 domain-containing protein n=1 Tax=Streptomyces himalayensis subsp. himalayensis TaxID=2756131 RepID=A0A7W0DH94_9ACTN|nr:SH3 domain-containing protein [Streptomyces himalayensis]MBA2944965.1 SH3 domain-containing protein [Streptomyces himalayensis subsp. himalayensis]
MAVDRIEGSEEEAQHTTQAASTADVQLRYYAIAPGYRVNVRSGPGTSYRIIRVLPEGSHVRIFCQRPGETVTGPYGTTNIWDNIAVGEYVSDAYVNTGSDGYIAPRCA